MTKYYIHSQFTLWIHDSCHYENIKDQAENERGDVQGTGVLYNTWAGQQNTKISFPGY